MVYKINYNNCNASYEGQTGRQLATRIKEHRSNKKYSVESLLVVSLHRLDDHDFDWDNILILDKESSYRKKILSEMLHISLQENGLNLQIDTDALDKSYHPIVKKCAWFLKFPFVSWPSFLLVTYFPFPSTFILSLCIFP